jgi:phosphate transport system substrate-binding protein
MIRALLGLVLVAALSLPASAADTLRVQGTLNQTAPLQKLAKDYASAHPGVAFDVQGTNAGQGIAALRAGTIDVAASDIAVDSDDFVDTNIGVLGVAFVTGPNTGIKNLTRDQLTGIYAGKITNWKQVGGNDQPIVLFGRNIGTGVRMLLEEKVAKQLVDTRNPVDPKELLAQISSTPGALGYTGLYFVRDHKDLIISYNGVFPTPENIRNHSYGFSTDEHLYVRKDGSAAARDFVTYVNSQRDTLAAFGIY